MSFDTPIGITVYPLKPISYGCEFVSGYAFKGNDFVETGIPVIKIKNIQNRKVTTEDSQCVSEQVITEKLDKFKLKNGDILIAMTGQGSVGRVGKLYISESERPYLNQRVGKFVTDERTLNKDFLYYVISTQAYENCLFSAGAGSGQPNLSPAIIKSIEIPYPPYDVQCHIGNVLKEFDDKIENNTKTNQTLEAIVQALFKSWFVDFDPVKAKIAVLESGGSAAEAELAAMSIISSKSLAELAKFKQNNTEAYKKLAQTAALFPSAMQESELGDIPDGWALSEIGKEVVVLGGGTPSTKSPEFWEGGDICWSTPKDMSNLKSKVLLETGRKITQAGLKKISSGLLPVNTVLMSSRAPVGYLALAKIPVAINQGYIAMKCENILSPEFVLLWCEQNMDEIKQRASGTTFAEISKSNFKPIAIVVPCKQVVENFTNKISELYTLITNNSQQSITLEKMRDSLLPRLLSGELINKDVNEV
jgi:type I restriction enzyme S subunit